MDPNNTQPSTPDQNASPQPSVQPEMQQTPPVTLPQEPKRKGKVGLIISMLVLVAVAIGVSGYVFFLQNNATTVPKVKVGVMMAFTGGSSSMGYGAMKGVQLAKKQFGADNIEIVQMDSKCDPKEAAEAIKRLIEQKVIAIIGEGCSSASVAALPAANNSKTVMISPSASSPTLSIPDDYFFRVIPPDTFQGEFMAQAIYDQGYRTVSVFYTNEPYGSGMNKVFQERFEALGGKVLVTTNAEPDVIDLNTQVQELKKAAADAVFFAPNSVVSGTAAVKLAREAGIKAPFFGADIFYDTTIIDNSPAETEGLTITSFPTGTKSFKQALLNESGKEEQLYAASQAYDAFHAIYLAVQQGATTGEQLKNKLPSISFEGVSAFIRFDQNGEISNKDYKYDLLQVKNGAFTILGQ